MECKECRSDMYLQAFSYGKCIECRKDIVTSHLPCKRYCEECSNKLKVCQQCGKKL